MAKSKGRRHLGRTRHNWKHDTKTDEAVALLVIKVTNLRIPYKETVLYSMELVSQVVSCEDINQTDNSGCESVIAERPTYGNGRSKTQFLEN